MAYATPKENWVSGEIPVASDFNRVEGNTKANHDATIAEVAARVADVDAEEAARIADVNAEEAARISGDNALNALIAGVDFVNGKAGTYGSIIVSAHTISVIPKGLYVMSAGGPEVVLQVKVDAMSYEGDSSAAGLVLSDGVNFALTNNSATPFSVYYRKLA